MSTTAITALQEMLEDANADYDAATLAEGEAIAAGVQAQERVERYARRIRDLERAIGVLIESGDVDEEAPGDTEPEPTEPEPTEPEEDPEA